MIYNLTSFKNISGPTSNRWDFPQKVLILDQKSHGTILEKIPRQVHIIPCQLELRTIALISTSCNNDFILSHQTPKKKTLLPSQHAPLSTVKTFPSPSPKQPGEAPHLKLNSPLRSQPFSKPMSCGIPDDLRALRFTKKPGKNKGCHGIRIRKHRQLYG